MTLGAVLARVCRLTMAVAIAVAGVVVAVIAMLPIPQESIYETTAVAAPAVLSSSFFFVLSATFIANPHLEALEAVASRSMLQARLICVATLALVLVANAAAVSLSVKDFWFFAPLLQGSAIMVSSTLAASVLLPKVYAAAVPLLYLGYCAFVSQGSDLFDLLLRHPSLPSSTVATALSLCFVWYFLRNGSRMTSTVED